VLWDDFKSILVVQSKEVDECALDECGATESRDVSGHKLGDNNGQ
jgi:hypothetical protein